MVFEVGTVGLAIGLVVVVGLVVGVLTPVLVPRARRFLDRPRRLGRAKQATYWCTAVGCLVCLVLGVPVPVFLAVAFANITLGRAEFVPISAFGMFGRPLPTATTLRILDHRREPVVLSRYCGLHAVNIKKRFDAYYHDHAVGAGVDHAAAHRAAALTLAYIEDSRRARRPERDPVDLTVSIVEHAVRDGKIVHTEIALTPAPNDDD